MQCRGYAAESEPLFLAGADSLLAAGLLSDDDEDEDLAASPEDELELLDVVDDEPERLSVL